MFTSEISYVVSGGYLILMGRAARLTFGDDLINELVCDITSFLFMLLRPVSLQVGLTGAWWRLCSLRSR